MTFFMHDTVTLNYRFKAGTGRPVVFLNSLGTDFRIWDAVIAGLPADTPVLCMDKRGHGLSDNAAITTDLLAADVAALMDKLEMPPSLICGVSVGGMIAQGLAATRPDLVAGMVLCCTGAKIGDEDSWNTRIATVNDVGLGAMASAVLERWFSPNFARQRPADYAGYGNMLTRTSPQGYAGVCAAIRDSDFSGQSVNVPTHCIAGADDLATPPALVRELTDLIPNATMEILPDCGHLPCIEAPAAVALAIVDMQKRLS